MGPERPQAQIAAVRDDLLQTANVPNSADYSTGGLHTPPSQAPAPAPETLMTSTNALPGSSGVLPFPGFSVRYTVDPDGTAWLVSRDVLSILDLDTTKHIGRHLNRTPETDRAFRDFQSLSGTQRYSVISIAAAVALTQRRKRTIDAKVRAFLQRETAHLVRDDN